MNNLYENNKYDSNNDYHQFLLSDYLLELDVIDSKGFITKTVLNATASEIHNFEKEAIKRVEKQLNDERIRKLNNSILI